MTDKELDELESIDPQERARLLERKDTFVLSSSHLDIIVNELLRDDDVKLARLIRDLVAFNVTGDNALIDNLDETDSADRTARKLLYDDCKVFIGKWLLKSIHNANNRKGKTKDSASAIASDTSQSDDDDGQHPTINEVKDYAKLTQGGLSDAEVAEIVSKWYDKETKSHWLDERGEPVRNWRKVFESYAQKAWIGKATDKVIR